MTPFNSGPSLVVISDIGRARQIPIPFGGIVLGRDARLGPPFSTDEFVSRSHTSVRRRGDGVEIADLGSANGTYVNGGLVHAPAHMQDGDVLRIGEIALKLTVPGAPTWGTGPGAVRYRVHGEAAEVISMLGPGRDNFYAIRQRENIRREVAATKTKARWLIRTGLVSFVAGFDIFAAGVIGFIHQASGFVSGGTAPSEISPFGQTVNGVPVGLIGWVMGALGLLLIIVGIMLHVVAASRRRRADRELLAGPPRP